MDYSLAVNDNDINELKLKLKIDAQRKVHEYAKLKKDLFDITYQASHTLTEFDGGMQQIDTEQSLKTKRTTSSFYDLLISRTIKMCNVRPIVGNVIGIVLSIIGLVFLLNFLNNPELKTLKIYLAYFIEIAAAVQVLKSASRSIVLPLVATIMGSIVSNQLTGHQLFLNQPSLFFQAMMITGLIGISISVFSID